MSLNYGKVSDLLVFDLINRDNPDLPIPVSVDNVIVEKITAIDPTSSGSKRNTRVRLRGVQGSGFRDSIVLYYDRVNIGRLMPWWNLGTDLREGNAAITNFMVTSLHDMLPAFYEKYGVNLQKKDVKDVVLPNPGAVGYFLYYSVEALPGSPAYVGSITCRLNRGLPNLEGGITSPNLPVLTHPIDISTKQQCVDLLTYGIDFTAYKNLLTVTSAGLPQWDGLRALLDSLGVPKYSAPVTSNLVADVPTSGNQFANQAYDRVVIQTGIDEAGAKGVAYYHYNN